MSGNTEQHLGEGTRHEEKVSVMKILNISSSGGIGGREMIVMTISDGLRARGCEVRLITSRGTWLHDAAIAGGYENYTVPMKKYIDLYSMYKIGAILRDFKPDVVHLYFISDIWLVVPAVKLFFRTQRHFSSGACSLPR